MLERTIRRDRLVISGVLAALTVGSWAQMVLPGDVPSGAERLMPCCGASFGVTFSMWVVMMAGMMIRTARCATARRSARAAARAA